MDVTDQDVLSVFGENHSASFVVPEYQRGYDWSEDNWRKLWQDIQNIGGRIDEHFLGTLILLKKGENNIEIVDGQQRLVTISIMIMAIRDLSDHDPDRKLDLVLSTISKDDRRIEYKTDEDDTAYEKLHSGDFDELDAQSNLKKGYKYFRRKINETYPDNPESLSEKIENLTVVRTLLHDPVKAYPIFQAQNDRGEDVEPHILARSRVFGAADRESDINKHRVTGMWKNNIEGELKRNLENPRYRYKDLRIRRPMTHILANSDVPTQTNIDKGDLYGVFETVVNSFEGIDEFVEWFYEETKLYMDTLTCSKYDLKGEGLSTKETRQLLYFNLSNTQAELLSLAIHKIVDENEEGLRHQCFKLAAVLGMRLELANYTATDKSKPIYVAASRVINEAEDGSGIKDILRDIIKNAENMPTDEEIRGALIDSDMYYTNQYQYRTEIKFSSLEEQRTNVRQPLHLENLVVDHIAPKKTFEDDTYTKWREGIDEEEFENRKHQLGNLILIDAERHKQLAYEESPEIKMSRLENVDMALADDVAERYHDAGKQWTDEQIDNRTEHLTEELIRRWSLPI